MLVPRFRTWLGADITLQECQAMARLVRLSSLRHNVHTWSLPRTAEPEDPSFRLKFHEDFEKRLGRQEQLQTTSETIQTRGAEWHAFRASASKASTSCGRKQLFFKLEGPSVRVLDVVRNNASA